MSYWSTLNARERLLIGWGIFALVATVLYISVLEPRYQRLSTLRQQVPAKQMDLAWMKAQLKQHANVLNNTGKQKTTAKLPLLTVVEQTATSAKLRANITRMQPGKDGAVRVWFGDVYFDPWLQWLEGLRKRGIQVSAANVSQSEAGKVNIRVTLVQ
jgi:type II secretory pathway component PulM